MESAPRRQVFHSYDMAANSNGHAMRFCPRCGSPCRHQPLGNHLRAHCRTCGYVHYHNPAPGVAIVVTEYDQVLLGKRIPTVPYGGRWAFPAGFIEFDEDFLTAARREAKEETGLDIAVTGILNVTSNYLTTALHALVIAVAARPAGGTLAAGDDLSEVRWLPLAGPFPPLAYEADAELLRVLACGTAPWLPVDPRYAAERLVVRDGLP
jgi:8-oxo-dGTP diphosphatase